MNRVSKMYTLRNGYSVCKAECYDGYNMQYFWVVFNPSGAVHKKCGSYEEAYKTASSIEGVTS